MRLITFPSTVNYPSARPDLRLHDVEKVKLHLYKYVSIREIGASITHGPIMMNNNILSLTEVGEGLAWLIRLAITNQVSKERKSIDRHSNSLQQVTSFQHLRQSPPL